MRIHAGNTNAAVLAAIIATPALWAQPLASVTAVRFWSLGETTRVAVETEGEFTFLQSRLSDPDRLFFDLRGTRSLVGRKPMHVIAVGDGVVKQIRVAEPRPEVTRVVLDLEAEVEHTASMLTNPSRLLIEVRRVGAPPASVPARPAPRSFVPPAARAVPKETIDLSPPPALGRRNGVPRGTGPLLLARIAFPPSPPEPGAKKPVAAEVVKPAPPAVSPPKEHAAAPAKRDSRGQSSMTRALGLKIRRVVIDPGHGGHDHGSTGPTGLREKDLTLDVAKRVGALIEATLGSEVVYTRTEDKFVPLEERTHMANENKADMFLSIHANSSPLRSASGSETYYLSFTTSRQALELAARENAASERTVFELQELLEKIALKDKVDESREFAMKVQSSLASMNARAGVGSRNRGVKKAPFVVLIGAAMPSVLAEIGFVSNAREEGLLKKPEHRDRIAEALVKGVVQYASVLSHFQVAAKKTDVAGRP